MSLGTSLQLLNPKFCHNVAIEPVLKPLSCETFHYATGNLEDEAHLNVSAQGFWGIAIRGPEVKYCIISEVSEVSEVK